MKKIDELREIALNKGNVILKNFNPEFEKARSGVYLNTSENRKLGRVGQKYGVERHSEEEKNKHRENIYRILKNVLSEKSIDKREAIISKLKIGYLEEKPMGSGGVGQIQEKEKEYRVQLGYGHGKYNYASTWIIPKSELIKLDKK